MTTLARLSVIAAMQKRDAICRVRPNMATCKRFVGARLVVVPVGLEAVVRELEGAGLCESDAAVRFARSIIKCLKAAVWQECELQQIPCAVDSHVESLTCPASFSQGLAPTYMPEHAVGISCWDANADVERQVRTSGELHVEADGGTAAVLAPASVSLGVSEILDLLQFAWRHTAVHRLRFVRLRAPSRQMTAPWEQHA
jgi:hypothetical protein